MVTGELVDFLPFDTKQPNGGETENHIIIMTNKIPTPYNDYHKDAQYCFSCSLKRSSRLQLWGVCKDSYLGKTIKIKVNYI